ncbi:hypothetical protein HFO32_04285 [Rhizobium leguminosarum]|uniref:hypothetical protein n=1 Tax=Rhizobium leguminosarum TaxID=384 RepID=UPI001C97CA6C|nr:hypothetical protein [Rhizobium leguminosarum]MBY5668065.1 hypothetical protein [Rhizobium leguminosarum]MBY5681416.1 hypothetical protein [Rhizobium leguminosarum]
MTKTDVSLVYEVHGYHGQVSPFLRAGQGAEAYQFKLAIEGDSWANILWPWSRLFGYNQAFSNYIDKDVRFYINNVGWPGDTFENIIAKTFSSDPGQRDKGLRVPIQSGIFDFLILSGGGNDFLGGGELTKFLKPFVNDVSDPWDCLDNGKVDRIFSRIRTGYLRLIEAVNLWSPKTHIFVHGYDHAIPRAGGHWLGTPFSLRGYDPRLRICVDIVRALVDRMYETLYEIAADNGRVHVVNLRGCCNNNWHDELHPNASSARLVAQQFIVSMTGAPRVATSTESWFNLEGRQRMDADHIERLVELGSSRRSIADVHRRAAEYMHGTGSVFPRNACAATLSAFLQMAGIPVRTMTGAGRLAEQIERDRNWDRIPVGGQRPGDVGVTYDTMAPPGADHVYLVVGVQDADLMTIADNQAPRPHERYASGRGRTRTSYFLRAPGMRFFRDSDELEVVDYSAFPFEDEDTNRLSDPADGPPDRNWQGSPVIDDSAIEKIAQRVAEIMRERTRK